MVIGRWSRWVVRASVGARTTEEQARQTRCAARPRGDGAAAVRPARGRKGHAGRTGFCPPAPPRRWTATTFDLALLKPAAEEAGAPWAGLSHVPPHPRLL